MNQQSFRYGIVSGSILYCKTRTKNDINNRTYFMVVRPRSIWFFSHWRGTIDLTRVICRMKSQKMFIIFLFISLQSLSTTTGGESVRKSYCFSKKIESSHNKKLRRQAFPLFFSLFEKCRTLLA